MTPPKVANGKPVDLKLEVVMLGVSDVDRAKAFSENLGWRLDADFATGDDWRVVQLTPQNSEASIIFGKGITTPPRLSGQPDPRELFYPYGKTFIQTLNKIRCEFGS